MKLTKDTKLNDALAKLVHGLKGVYPNVSVYDLRAVWDSMNDEDVDLPNLHPKLLSDIKQNLVDNWKLLSMLSKREV